MGYQAVVVVLSSARLLRNTRTLSNYSLRVSSPASLASSRSTTALLCLFTVWAVPNISHVTQATKNAACEMKPEFLHPHQLSKTVSGSSWNCKST